MTEVNVSDSNRSKEELIEELASLQQNVAELQAQKIAFDTLHELLLTSITTVKTVTGTLMLRTVLQQILKIAIRLTDADESSLFLLDAEGRVSESILARGAVIRDLKQKLVGMVLDKGLAGWVIRHRKVGLVTDTMEDERWLTLPNEPYTVRSALSIPLCRGKVLLAIITLMHSKPEHFSAKTAQILELCAEQMALIVENALLHVEHQPSQPEPHAIAPKGQRVREASRREAIVQHEKVEFGKTEELSFPEQKLSSFGIYVIFNDGRFMYTNPGVAAIFGYTFIEFITIQSIFELIISNSQELVNIQINQCFKAPNKCLDCTFKGKRKDGNIIDVHAYGTKTKLNGKPVIVGLMSAN
jgi:PAS domain S-box-containing protein